MPLSPTLTGRLRAHMPSRTTRYILCASIALAVLYLSFRPTRGASAAPAVATTLPTKLLLAPSRTPTPVRYPPQYDGRPAENASAPSATLTSTPPLAVPATSASLDASSASSSSISSSSASASASPIIPVQEADVPEPTPRRANATLLMLARNGELEKAVQSVRELEDKFNREFKYPWVFLNEVPFSDQFIETMTELASGPVFFGQIPAQHWWQPDWIDQSKAEQGRREMVERGIIYAGSMSYRNMCRYNSGFFYRHPLLQNYRWYWRVEPDVHFHCVVDEDPFLFMEDNDKRYAFTITLLEFQETIKTLWDTTKEFMLDYPEFVAPNNSIGYLSNDGGETYNLCHFWSNFEIADMDFWRSDAYDAYFRYLDAKGGFYYERWGDAPVHSIAAGLLLRKDQIHFFDAIGYEHAPFTHCPHGPGLAKAKKCSCRGWRSFDYQGFSCLKQWERIHQ